MARLTSLTRLAALNAVLALLLVAPTASSAGPLSSGLEDSGCTTINHATDLSSQGYQKVMDSLATLGDCKAGIHVMFSLAQIGPMTEGYTQAHAAIDMPIRDVKMSEVSGARGLMSLAELGIDCVPWRAEVRMQNPGGGQAAEAWVSIDGTVVGHSDEGGNNADVVEGCAPLIQASSKPDGTSEESFAHVMISGGRLYIYATLVRADDPVDYDSIERQASVDPWISVDPDWPYADLFEVQIETCEGCGTYAPMRRDWMSIWTDASTPAMATPDNAAWASFVDVDNDGDLDIHVYTSGTTPDRLYVNDGTGGFTESASGALAATVGVMGLAWGDYDNDGDLDLFLARPAGYPNALLRNDGGLVFTDVTAGPIAENGNWLSPAWADYDLDGDLDLFVSSFGSATPNRLFRNDSTGVFTAVASPVIGDSTAAYRCGASVNWVDYDGDGDPDLSINTYESGADTSQSRLYRNDLGGNFSETTPPEMRIGQIGQGSAWGDYDNDLDLDYFKVNYSQDSRFFRNDGAGNLARSRYPLVDAATPARCALWEDFDRDGDLDLYTGYYGGEGANLFNYRADVDSFVTSFWTNWGPINYTGTTSSIAAGDYDNDGDLDICATGDGRVFLFRNDTESQNHWLHVDLIGAGPDSNGTGSNRYGIGANIRVFSGGNVQMREVTASPGWYCGSSITAEFGLGSVSVVDSVQVRWPGGRLQTLVGPTNADRKLTIREGESATGAEPGRNAPTVPRLLPCGPNPFSGSTMIRFVLPEAAPAWIQVYDPAGRLVRTLRSGAELSGGSHQVVWDARDDAGQPAGSGIYFVRLRVGDRSWTSRMVVLN